MSVLKNVIYRKISRISEALSSPEPKGGLRVLMYHSVGTTLADDPYGNSIGEALFRKHMEHVASLRGKWDCVLFSAPSAERPQIALTFDDGYKDTLTTAAPIVAALGLPMTVFVTTANLAKPGKLYLNAAELKELAALPRVLIGAHGHTHARLDALGDEQLRHELSESRKRLEDLIGKTVDTLSYPHGAVNRRVRDAAVDAGYRLGGTSRYGLNTQERDPLLLCRTEVTAFDSVQDLSLKVRGHWDWYRLRHPDPAAS